MVQISIRELSASDDGTRVRYGLVNFCLDLATSGRSAAAGRSESNHGMPFKEQSDYKCESVGLSSERFNDVIWE